MRENKKVDWAKITKNIHSLKGKEILKTPQTPICLFRERIFVHLLSSVVLASWLGHQLIGLS